jgi:hypothetical protein
MKSRIIVTSATEDGRVVVAELLKAGYPVRTMVRREDGRKAQAKEKGRLMKQPQQAVGETLAVGFLTQGKFC